MRSSLACLALLLWAACRAQEAAPPEVPTPPGSAPAAESLPSYTPAYAGCPGHPPPAMSPGSFSHTGSAVVASAGAPEHSLQDLLATPGEAVTVVGKFAYGSLSKDLEDEPVKIWLDDCSGWKLLGDATTDDDGRARLTFNAPAAPGRYRLRMQVVGDGSLAEGWLQVAPRGARVVVFDIDGTLTTSDREILKDIRADLFEPIRKKSYTPKGYPGGVLLTHRQAARGALLLYMTGRPYWLTQSSRDWLQQLGYAPGVLHLTDSNEEALPTEAGVGNYKLNFLRQVLAKGFVIETAYGNASTDIYAYLTAGLSNQAVYIIGPHAGELGTHAVRDSWEAEAARVLSLPPVEKP